MGKQIETTLQQQDGFKQLSPQLQQQMIYKFYVQQQQHLLNKAATASSLHRNVSPIPTPVPTTSPIPFLTNFTLPSSMNDAPQTQTSSLSKSPLEVTTKSEAPASIWESVPSPLKTPTLGKSEAAIWYQNTPITSSVWDIEPLKTASSNQQLLMEKQKELEKAKELERQKLIQAEE